MDVQLTVRGSRVLVRAEDQQEHTNESGIVIVESHAPEVIGTVLQCGLEVADVKAGDVVLFSPQSGREIEWGGETYLALDEDEILAVWDEEKEPV